ncbi:MAG: PEGA domain-containing protein [Methanoregulaceae archaeon]
MTLNQNVHTKDGMEFATRRTPFGLMALAGMLLISILACAVPVSASDGWGSIQIWSTPGNAYVQVDNYWAGWTDNSGSLTLDGIPGNSYHSVQVTKDGYQTFYDSMYVSRDATNVENVNLAPNTPSGWGSIQVWTTPGNAYVEIDDYWAGWSDSSGSAAFSGIPGNSYHKIEVSKSGYRTFTDSIYVQKDVTQVVNVNL